MTGGSYQRMGPMGEHRVPVLSNALRRYEDPERSGDPRYTQRVRLPGGGSAVSWSADTPEGRMVREASKRPHCYRSKRRQEVSAPQAHTRSR